MKKSCFLPSPGVTDCEKTTQRRARIGGVLDYSALAKLHRPDDPDTLAREAHALAAAGLTYDDVAACLGLTRDAVKQLLNPKEARPWLNANP